MLNHNIEHITLERGADLWKLTPDNPRMHPIPVVVLPGYGVNFEAFSLFTDRLCDRGYTVLCPDFPLGKEPRRLLFLPNVDQGKFEAIEDTIKYVGGPVGVVTHSKASIDVMPVAYKYPDLFPYMVLVAPGGLHPERGFIQALKTLASGYYIRDHKHKKQLAKEGDAGVRERIIINSEVGKEYRKRVGAIGNFVRLILENWTSATVTIDQHFPELKAQGVRIVIAAMEQDGFFPPVYLNPSGVKPKGVENFVIIPGIHGAMKFIPETCDQVINLYAAMESNSFR